MELETNEPARLKDIQERSKKVKDAIETSRTVSLAALSQVVKRWYNIEDVTEFLTNKAQFPKKTRASDAFAKVLENIQSEMEEALKTEADKVSEIIKEYLTAYDEMQFHLSSQEFGQF